jgi:UDP-N-acetylglucosamine 2-epimerase (non-hydrolysing)
VTTAPDIDLIAGARPNFMKVASIIDAIRRRNGAGASIRHRLVHTGQHYDPRMSADFFAQLGIPSPDVNLGVGSGSAAEQTAGIMVGYERLLECARPKICVVVGDVTSTMACAITARKRGVRVGHVEAGIRSGDWSMPEEINRVVTDSVADLMFTTSEHANRNLRAAGVADECVHFVGNTMIDTLLAHRHRFRPPSFWPEHGLHAGKYFVLTLHRPSNVDDAAALKAALSAIADGAGGMPVVFAVHPRTAKVLAAAGGAPRSIVVVDPQPYLEFNYLVEHACAVVTDSGGITEEATVLGVPCMTLRTTTERPETIELGTNELLGTDLSRLRDAMARARSGSWKRGAVPPLWDGRTGERIVAVLERELTSPLIVR